MSKKGSAEEARERILSGEIEDNLENSGRRTTVKAKKEKRSNLIPLLGILFVFGLLALALFLPPISLLDRLSGDTTSTAAVPSVPTNNLAATTSLSDGTALALMDGSATVSLSAVGQDAILADTSGIWGNAAAVLPNNATPLGNFYELAYSGNAPVGSISIPVSGNAASVDLYGWDGASWQFVPSSLGNGVLESAVTTLPRGLALMQLSAPTIPSVGTQISNSDVLAPVVLPQLTEVMIGTLNLTPSGELLGQLSGMPQGGYDQYIYVTNRGAIIDQASLIGFLGDQNAQNRQITDLTGRVAATGVAGVNIDYQGVNTNQRDAFTQFINNLAASLQSQGKKLIVTLDAPAQLASGWESGGQDWQAIGRVANAVYVNAPISPSAYNDGGTADSLLQWATRQLSRDKLTLFVTANAVDSIGTAEFELPAAFALENFGAIVANGGTSNFQNGEAVNASLSGNTSGFQWDSATQHYTYTYDQGGQIHTVYMSNEAALANRMRLAKNYNLRGAAVRGLGNTDGNSFVSASQYFMGQADAPQPQGAAVVWTVTDSNGGVISTSTGEALDYNFAASDVAGDYAINADFAIGSAVTRLSTMPFTVGETAMAQAEPAAEESVAVEAEPVPVQAVADASAVVAQPVASAQTIGTVFEDADATTNIASNFRTGPSLNYTVIEIVDGGTPVNVLGTDGTGQWYQVELYTDQRRGWLFGQLLNFNSDFNRAGVQTINVTAASSNPAPGGSAQVVAQAPAQVWPTSTPLPQGRWNQPAQQQIWPTNTPLPVGPWYTPVPTKVWPTRTPAPAWPTNTPAPVAAQPTAQPAAAAPAPSGNLGAFEMGGQTHTLANPSQMKSAGMKWVKIQHKWSPGQGGQDVAGKISAARSNGFKILLSMPGSNTYPTSIDFDAYVDFLGEVAAQGPDAIEIWNEMNIDFEWPAGQISPQQYVDRMLRPGYQKIKAVNPNIMVILGAPAPTGFDNNTNAWADDRYMAGVAAAGGGSFADCIGVHHNAGAVPPSQSTGHPADGGAQHYSWYFTPTLNMYYNAFGGSRPVCFTEIGYLSTQGYPGTPTNFSWAKDTTVTQHANWLAEAAQLSANSGKVKMFIVFNVDLTHFDINGDPQAGYAIIRPDGSCPACSTLGALGY